MALKYSMAPPSEGERAAKRERTTNNRIDRNLQRAMRSGSPAARLEAGKLYQQRSNTPGYQQGGGIGSAEGNRERDRITAENYTKEGLQLKNNTNQNVNPGTAQDANAIEQKNPANPAGRPLQRSERAAGQTQEDFVNERAGPVYKENAVGPVDVTEPRDPRITAGNQVTPYTNTPTPQGGMSPKDFATDALKGPNIYEKGVKPDDIAKGLAATQGVGNASNPIKTTAAPQEAPANTTTTPQVASTDTMADRGNSKIAGYQKATADAKTKFADDLKKYGTSGKRSPEKDAQIREYGKTLNLNEDQINAAMRGDTKLDAKSAAASASAYEKNAANKAANTPEARNKRSTDEFSKAYGNYLNGEGKGASEKERAAKYNELKGKATKDGFVVTKEAEDKVFEDRFNARVERAVKSGMSREDAISETSRRDNSTQEVLDLIPGAKRDVQAAIDLADMMTGSKEDALGDYKAKADSLRKKRGAPAISDAQRQIVTEGNNNIQRENDPTLQSTGNPLYDDLINKPIKEDLTDGSIKDDPTGSIEDPYKNSKSSQPKIDVPPINPKNKSKEKTFIEAALNDAGSVYDFGSGVTKQIIDQGKYNAIDAIGQARKVWAGAQEVGPSMLTQFLPGDVGEWSEKKSKENFQNLGKRSQKIDASTKNLKDALDSPQASVNTKQKIQKSAAEVVSYSDNLNRYLLA